MSAKLKRWVRFSVIAIASILLNSCGTNSPPPHLQPIQAAPVNSIPAIPAPTPTIHLLKASYYGHQFDGKKTTSGERYSPEKLTAASKTLPLGTVVTVENPRNGKSVNVRINDRGPFVKGRGLDLSHRAAERIGITHQGVARVKVVVPPKKRHQPGSNPAPRNTEEASASLDGASP
jgi:peptidoglycan lytic transglycosylase